MKSKAVIVPKVRMVVTSSGEGWSLLDLCGSYEGVGFIILDSTVHLCFRCVRCISQHNIFLNGTTFSFVLGVMTGGKR